MLFSGGERQVFNLAPFTDKHFRIRGLGDTIKDLHNLLYLYPDIPKARTFSKFWTQGSFCWNQNWSSLFWWDKKKWKLLIVSLVAETIKKLPYSTEWTLFNIQLLLELPDISGAQHIINYFLCATLCTKIWQTSDTVEWYQVMHFEICTFCIYGSWCITCAVPCVWLVTDVPTMQAGGYVPPALTLVIPGYDMSVLPSIV